MRVTWEKEDIVPGRQVGYADKSERWIIGYLHEETGKTFALISLADGLVSERGTQNGIAAHLNETGAVPAVLLQ
jgi:hypothetical protein